MSDHPRSPFPVRKGPSHYANGGIPSSSGGYPQPQRPTAPATAPKQVPLPVRAANPPTFRNPYPPTIDNQYTPRHPSSFSPHGYNHSFPPAPRDPTFSSPDNYVRPSMKGWWKCSNCGTANISALHTERCSNDECNHKRCYQCVDL